jgi:MFS family permease
MNPPPPPPLPIAQAPAASLRWHRLAALNALAFALGFASNTVEPAVLGHQVLDLAPGFKNTAFGLLTFAGLVVAVAWQPLIGDLSDRTRGRWGRRVPYFIGGSVLLVFSLLMITVAPSLVSLLGFLLLLQIAANTIQSPSQALIPDHVPSRQRGAAAGWKSVLEILAFVAGRRVSSNLVADGETLKAAAVAGAVVLVCLVVVLLVARESSRQGDRPRFDLHRAFAFDRRAYPAFVPWFTNRVLLWGGFIALSTFMLFFVIDVLGLSEANAQRFVGDISTIMGLGLLLVALPAGWIADRIAKRHLVAISGVLAAGGTTLLIAFPTITTALIAASILGLAVGVFLTTSWALATQIVPEFQAARMLGIANIATAAGSGLARLGGGLIIDPVNRLSGDPALGYFVLFGLAGLAFLLGTLAILRLPPD